jgi:hypothetical protein
MFLEMIANLVMKWKPLGIDHGEKEKKKMVRFVIVEIG